MEFIPNPETPDLAKAKVFAVSKITMEHLIHCSDNLKRMPPQASQALLNIIEKMHTGPGASPAIGELAMLGMALIGDLVKAQIIHAERQEQKAKAEQIASN